MTSLPLSEIIIDRPARQRRSIGVSIDELASSISRTGLIHPPVITRENVLVAGERRITAMRQLGWTSTEVRYTDEIDPEVLALIEFEENIQRLDIPWQDEVNAVADYHDLRRRRDKGWTAALTAKAIGFSGSYVEDSLMIAQELRAGNILVRDADKRSVAKGLTVRARDRRRTSVLENLSQSKEQQNASHSAPSPPLENSYGQPQTISQDHKKVQSKVPIKNVDFLEWAPAYSGPPFNFVHCDFPYGINADKRQQGSSVYRHGGYADSPEVYWRLCAALAENLNRLTSPSAHLMFWFSMDYYTETQRFFAKELPEWIIQPFPVYWSKSDNVGLLPDPKRGPRRVVETALLGSRGDRQIVQAVSNHVAAPTERRDGHISVKPLPVLRHFFRMFVDSNTSILDPTCGLGSSLRAARASGAHRILGLEINPEFAALATDLWNGADASPST